MKHFMVFNSFGGLLNAWTNAFYCFPSRHHFWHQLSKQLLLNKAMAPKYLAEASPKAKEEAAALEADAVPLSDSPPHPE